MSFSRAEGPQGEEAELKATEVRAGDGGQRGALRPPHRPPSLSATTRHRVLLDHRHPYRVPETAQDSGRGEVRAGKGQSPLREARGPH